MRGRSIAPTGSALDERKPYIGSSGGRLTKQVGIWQVTSGGPKKLAQSQIQLEQNLEDWIERDPALLDASLTIVGRQITTDAGNLDLLGIDPQGRWFVIELKRGLVS